MKVKNLDTLRNEVEQAFSRKIRTASDCMQLSDEIFAKTGSPLNANTLRRCFGLVKSDYPPSIATLNILSKYCGFSSFDELIDYKKTKAAAEPALNKSLLSFWVSLFSNCNIAQKDDPVYMHMVRATIQHFKQEPELVYVFQKEIAKTRNGQEYYFEEFVNIDKLAGYFGAGLRYYLAEKRTTEAQVFGHSLLALKAWLTEDAPLLEKHYREVMNFALHPGLHPFAQGRHFATRLLHAAANGQDASAIILEAAHAFEQLKPSHDHYRHFPCFQLVVADALLLTGHFEEALFYAGSGVAAIDRTGAKIENSPLFNALLLYKAAAWAQTGQVAKAKELFAGIDPADFYFLSRQYLMIHYLQLSAKLHKSKEHKEQLHFLIEETGFKKLAVHTTGAAASYTGLRVA